MRYLVSYDLTKPETSEDYERLWKALRDAGAVRILYSEWIVRYANSTPKQVGDYFIQFMDGNDGIFITEVPSSYAYRNLKENIPAA